MTASRVAEMLQTATSLEELVDVIDEIVVDEIGAEEYAIFEVDHGGAHLNLLGCAGINPEPLREVGWGEGVVGKVAASGRLFIKPDGLHDDCVFSEDSVTACIPLKHSGRLTGAVAIFGVSPAKDSFTPSDFVMFDLLSRHAAAALYTAAFQDYKGVN